MSGLLQRFSRRPLWSRRLLLLAGTVLVAALTLWLVPTPYYITAPGAAIDTARLVGVQGGTAHDGRLLMLVVTTQPANLFWYLYAQADSRAELETREQFLGEIEDYPKYVELTRRMMADSQQTAKAVALYLAGYGQGVRSHGAEVTDLTGDSPSKGFLVAGDVVIELEGRPVTSAVTLREALSGVTPGKAVAVRVRRAKAELSLTVPTAKHPEHGGAALGVFIKDALTFDIPLDVQIKAGLITGPSAGLMFTLQIIDQLTPGGITGDMRVAGTGTIEADGAVGPIGGVQQKVFAAEAAGARVFFTPRQNYDAAKAVATRIEVVPVDNVRDALTWLREHR